MIGNVDNTNTAHTTCCANAYAYVILTTSEMYSHHTYISFAYVDAGIVCQSSLQNLIISYQLKLIVYKWLKI